MTLPEQALHPGRIDTGFKHFGYVVDNIAEAAPTWSQMLGVGPFIVLDRVAFDLVRYLDGPAFYEHSVAFALWGSVVVELMEFHGVVEPESLAARMSTPSNRLNHAGYSVVDVDAERSRLEALGAQTYLLARTGDVEGVVLWVPQFGHSVELLKDSDFIRDFAEQLRTITDDWDGTDLLRRLT